MSAAPRPRPSVMLCHNRYGSQEPSGENEVVESERRLLLERGHRVDEFVRESDALRARGLAGKLLGAAMTPWNPFAAAELAERLERGGHDVLHAHNTFPMISPAAFARAPERVARVLTLHNYRLFCARAVPLREGRPCTECLERRASWPSVAHGCYRDSRAATVPLALSISLHRALGTWTRHVDAFVALSSFQRELMIEGGLPAERVHVKPNFCRAPAERVPWAARRPGAVFAGRLSAEKGADVAVDAWRRLGPDAPPLTVIGDGPERAALGARSADLSAVRFAGRLSGAATREAIGAARLLVVPSRWFEGFPMVVAEAFAAGTPVIASDIGSLATIVTEGRNGRRFPVGDDEALARVLNDLLERPDALARLHEGAVADYRRLYSEAGNHAALLDVYDAALAHRRGPGGGPEPREP